MSNTKHTPGPWKIDTARDPEGLTVRATTPRGFYPIAEVKIIGDIGTEQGKANAALIARAPELEADYTHAIGEAVKARKERDQLKGEVEFFATERDEWKTIAENFQKSAQQEVNGYFRVNECEEGHELAIYKRGFAPAEIKERVIIGVFKTRAEAWEEVNNVLITFERKEAANA